LGIGWLNSYRQPALQPDPPILKDQKVPFRGFRQVFSAANAHLFGMDAGPF
jgi:hypothetical protein